MLVIKKARKNTYVPDPNRTIRGKPVVSFGNREEVKNPGSRGGHWYYNKNHQVEYGDPPSGHTGLHSGDYHQMFVQHAPTPFAKTYFGRSIPEEAHRHKYDEKALISRSIEAMHGHHDAKLEELRDDVAFDPEDKKARADYEKAIAKFGKNLDEVHKGIMKHGLDKDEEISTKYMRARRNHAQRLMDTDQLQVKLPTLQELKAMPFPKTHQDIINMANSFLPHTHFDIEHMDFEAADTLVYQFFTLAAEHDPEMFRSLEHFGTKSPTSNFPEDWSLVPNEIAHMANNNTYMGFNIRFAADITRFRREVEEGLRTGWSVSGEVKHIVTHEFGHMVDNFLMNHPKWSDLLLDFKQSHVFSDATSGYARYNDKWLDEVNDLYEQTGYKEKDWKARYERREQWAESFVAINVRKPENLTEYELHHRRLLEFIRENPNFDPEKHVFTKQELAHFGIDTPYYVKAEGDDYE